MNTYSIVSVSVACRQLLTTVQKKSQHFLLWSSEWKLQSVKRFGLLGSQHRPFLLETLHITRSLSTCIRNYAGKVMNILLQGFLVFWWYQIRLRDSWMFQWQILETSRSLCTIPTPQVSLWPSNIKNSWSLHWFFPSPVQCMLSSIYSLFSTALFRDQVWVSLGVNLSICLAQDHCAVCDSGQKQMPKEEFSSRIIIQSHLSGVTSQLPAMHVSGFQSEKSYLGMQYASKALPSVNESTHPFNHCEHCHPHGCSHHVLNSTWAVSDDAERDDRLLLLSALGNQLLHRQAARIHSYRHRLLPPGKQTYRTELLLLLKFSFYDLLILTFPVLGNPACPVLNCLGD